MFWLAEATATNNASSIEAPEQPIAAGIVTRMAGLMLTAMCRRRCLGLTGQLFGREAEILGECSAEIAGVLIAHCFGRHADRVMPVCQ